MVHAVHTLLAGVDMDSRWKDLARRPSCHMIADPCLTVCSAAMLQLATTYRIVVVHSVDHCARPDVVPVKDTQIETGMLHCTSIRRNVSIATRTSTVAIPALLM